MSLIRANIANQTLYSQLAHVFDYSFDPPLEVKGSPFNLRAAATSASFPVRADEDGVGRLGYQCEGGDAGSVLLVQEGGTVVLH